ncbi:HAD family hydrolase [Halostella sp. JP-L12]|uniref:HAD family hydrolase n=1 Tax=Halostella TaxID=1843185 RepID=UPI000EF79F58|nr:MULTISPECIES: HAD family hydrolase [Halostella]NHN49061.1 HAD family hydrolase [Halostella sp. JP-L12]
MRPQAVYFNLDLTLTRMERPFDALVVETLQRADVPDPEIDPTRHSNLFFDRFLDLVPEPMAGAYEAYFDELDAEVEMDPAEAAGVQKQLEVDAVRPAVDDLPALIEAIGEEFPVGVLTSGLPDLQRAKLEKLGVLDALDDVAISYELDATKESGDLFAAAEGRLGDEESASGAYVYVSNHDSDVEAAEAAGWTAVRAEAADLADDPVGFLDDAL